MLSNDFLESRHSYRVSIGDMDTFLKECEAEGLMWSHGLKPTEFDPFKFYEGDKIQYLAPIQQIKDRNVIYVKCFYGKLHFSFCYNWNVQPAEEYRGESYE
jgi:hypothetical protein